MALDAERPSRCHGRRPPQFKLTHYPAPEALDAREVLGEDWKTVVEREQRPIVGCQWSAP